MHAFDATHLMLSESFWAQTPELRFSDAALALTRRLADEMNLPLSITRKWVMHSMVNELHARAPIMMEERITGVDYTVRRGDGEAVGVFTIDLACLLFRDSTGEQRLCFDVDVQ